MIQYIKIFTSNIYRDRITSFAAQMAYTLLLALFPLALFIGSFFSYFHFDISALTDFLIKNTSSSVYDAIFSFSQSQIQKANIGINSPIFYIMILSISFGLFPLIGALNHMFSIEETRSYFRCLVTSIIGTLMLMVSIITSVIIFALHSSLIEYLTSVFGVNNNLRFFTIIIAYIILGSSIFMFLMYAYTFMPAQRYRFIVNVRAALISTIFWMVFTGIFAYYLLFLNTTYNIFYGSLATIIAIITWFYISSIAILIGMEVEVVRELVFHQNETPHYENKFLSLLDFISVKKIFKKLSRRN